MSKSQKNYSPNNVPTLQFATSLQDRLRRIYGTVPAAYALRLAQQARSFRDLIRRYSNDSML